jgi:predicted alpha/beta superfamily hydrolase
MRFETPVTPTITRTEPAFVSHSAETGADYTIYIGAPDAALAPGPWAAVLVMDGDYMFDAAAAGRSLRDAGHSLGSLLALHALFRARPFFNLALASAPSIWWDNRSILGLVSALRDRQTILRGRPYLDVGENDTPSMSGDLGLLEKQLENRPFEGLRVDCERFPGRDHYDVLPHSMRAGLATLLG